MQLEIEVDYDNSNNKRIRYIVRSDGYIKGANLTKTKAQQLRNLLRKSINVRQQLRSKFRVMSDR